VWYKDPGRKIEILLKGAERPLKSAPFVIARRSKANEAIP